MQALDLRSSYFEVVLEVLDQFSQLVAPRVCRVRTRVKGAAPPDHWPTQTLAAGAILISACLFIAGAVLQARSAAACFPHVLQRDARHWRSFAGALSDLRIWCSEAVRQTYSADSRSCVQTAC